MNVRSVCWGVWAGGRGDRAAAVAMWGVWGRTGHLAAGVSGAETQVPWLRPKRRNALFKFAQRNKTSLIQILKLNSRPRIYGQGFPGGAVVEGPPANAGVAGSSPGPGGSHMPRSSWARAPRLLSLRSGAHEPQLLSPRATIAEACTPGARAPQQGRPPW